MVHCNSELFYIENIQSWPHFHKQHTQTPLDPAPAPEPSSLSGRFLELEIHGSLEIFLVLEMRGDESCEDSKVGAGEFHDEHAAFDDIVEPSLGPFSLFFETDERERSSETTDSYPDTRGGCGGWSLC